MAKTRRARPGIFDAAFGIIDKMEQAVCYRAVTRGYSVNDVCDYLWPAEVVNALRTAFPYSAQNARGRYWSPQVVVNDVSCSFIVEAADMVTPAPDLIRTHIEGDSVAFGQSVHSRRKRTL